MCFNNSRIGNWITSMYVSTQLSSHSQHRAIHRKREYFNQLESFAVINFSGCIDLHWSLRLTFWSSWLDWVRSDWWAETDWVLQLKLLNFYPWPGLAPRSQSCYVLSARETDSVQFCHPEGAQIRTLGLHRNQPVSAFLRWELSGEKRETWLCQNCTIHSLSRNVRFWHTSLPGIHIIG